MSQESRQQLQAEFDIPTPLAIAVVLAHFSPLAAPLAVIWAVDVYSSLVPIAHPTMIKIASAIYIGATAFEVAQNSADRWYLTEATRSVADCFFNSFMTLAFCLYAIGFYANFWITSVAIVLTVLYPFAYINNHAAHRAINGIVVLLGTISLFLVTGDPTVFLFLVVNFLAVYLIVLLMQNHSQWLHAWAALIFGIAFLAWPWAIMNAASGQSKSWLFVGGVTAAVIVAALLATPYLKKMSKTPRVHGSGSASA